MRKVIASAVALAILAGYLGTSWSQNTGTQRPAAKPVPHRVGLIDMARVFKEYDKFEALRGGLKGEIQSSDQKAKAMALQVQKLQAEMKNFKQGTDAYISRESQLTKLASDFEAFRKVAQRDFLRKESQIYRTIYLEAVDVVQKYAEYYNYTLVLRFNGEKLDTADPQKLIQGLNRQVVYHRNDDDITDSVLEFLNRQYGAAAKKPASTRTSQKPGPTGLK